MYSSKRKHLPEKCPDKKYLNDLPHLDVITTITILLDQYETKIQIEYGFLHVKVLSVIIDPSI